MSARASAGAPAEVPSEQLEPAAEATPSGRVLEFRFTPVHNAQIAIWLGSGVRDFLQTVALTEATARRGIGNRPGASQMTSGFRWPYGRREGVLPIWTHKRVSAQGAQPFAE